MAAPSHVFTIAKVAKMLDEDEALLEQSTWSRKMAASTSAISTTTSR